MIGDLTMLLDDTSTTDEQIEAMQNLIDAGVVWHMEGAMGRAAMDMIERGLCVLGETGCRDYWGGYVPSRYEVEPGTKGSMEYAERMQAGEL